MYVIMDMEWYQGKNCAFITQLSGLRLDENYRFIDRCDLLAAPLEAISRGKIDWSSLAFAGHERGDFLASYPQFMVIEKFHRWLNYDDVLIWWHAEAENLFLQNLKTMQFHVPESRVVNRHIRKLLPNDKNDGSPFSICRKNRFPFNVPEHCSAIDVDNFRSLLFSVSFRLESLYDDTWKEEPAPCPVPQVTKPAAKPKKSPGVITVKSIKYYFDHTNHLMHKGSCPHCIPDSYSNKVSISFALRKGLKPCSCCYNEFENLAFTSATRPTQVGLIYSTGSRDKIVHHANCSIVKKISSEKHSSFPSAKAAVDAGYRFCKTCSSVRPYYQPISF